MGYTTEFYGYVSIDPPLSPELVEYINCFSRSRHMRRNVAALTRIYPDALLYGYPGPNGLTLGNEGEYFCLPNGVDGERETIVNGNEPPSTQPGLWCQWVASSDGSLIEWDGGEKFYESDDWMRYIIDNFIAPFGHSCNGEIQAQGEDHDDSWVLIVEDNFVTTKNTDPSAMRRIEKALRETMTEIDSIVKRIDYASHMEELLATASPDQLDLIKEIRGRLADVYGRSKGLMEGP